MSTCEAKINNKKCSEPAIKGSKYCKDHQDFERPVRSKSDTGHGSGDTQDHTGKDQPHGFQPKGGGNARVGGGGPR